MTLRSTRTRPIPVIDLFAGPGGLGEGFSATKLADTKPAFKVQLSIEKDPAACETLTLRAFFRQFPSNDAPAEYYSAVAGDSEFADLYRRHPQQAAQATREVWCKELEEDSRSAVHDRIRSALGGADNWVLIGGPPCQAYSLVGRVKNQSLEGYRPENDPRHFLYKEYLHVVAKHRPAVFVMENVKGILSAEVRKEKIFEQILEDLRAPGRAIGQTSDNALLRYDIVALGAAATSAPDDFIVQAERYAVPQRRHRVILVGLRSDVRVALRRLTHRSEVTVADVLDGLPSVRSGLSKGDNHEAWTQAVLAASQEAWFKAACKDAGVARALKRSLDSLASSVLDRGQRFTSGVFHTKSHQRWYADFKLNGVVNHETRGHMKMDLHRYLFATAFADAHGYAPELPVFPKRLLPKHLNLQGPPEKWPFKDRFNVQVANAPASTITSHISKDGHHDIHYDPNQVRSLTVREAARLQTFPDNYYFMGTRTQSFHQVGNAVPPLLAAQIARRVLEVLS